MTQKLVDSSIISEFSYYNKRANCAMNDVIKILSPEEWNREFHAAWKSIHILCSHIFTADYSWLNRFRLFTNCERFYDNYFCKSYEWDEMLFQNIDEYLKQRNELDDIIIDFMNQRTNNELCSYMKWKDWEGNIITHKLNVFMTHMFNHATHHRAQISLYLDMMGYENDFSVFFERS